MRKIRIAVFVSGGGTNLQALLDAQQAGKLGCPVLYVNSLCKDKVGDDIARGGAALFVGGTIVQEVPSGEENVLFVEI